MCNYNKRYNILHINCMFIILLLFGHITLHTSFHIIEKIHSIIRNHSLNPLLHFYYFYKPPTYHHCCHRRLPASHHHCPADEGWRQRDSCHRHLQPHHHHGLPAVCWVPGGSCRTHWGCLNVVINEDDLTNYIFIQFQL